MTSVRMDPNTAVMEKTKAMPMTTSMMRELACRASFAGLVQLR